LSPWWQRPTAEGAQDDEGDDRPGRPPEPAEREPPAATPADAAGAPESADLAPRPVAPPRPAEAPAAEETPFDEPDEEDEEGGGEAAAERPAERARRSRRRRRRPRDGAEEEAPGREARGDAGRPAPPRRERPPDDEEDLTFDFSPDEIERISREIVVSAPERSSAVSDERKIALFCDLENIAIGVRDSEIKKFDIHLILERLLEKGKIIVKKAYCDWERYSDYKRPFHEAAIEMIDIPQRYYSGKNSADIKMVVDAMDLSYSKEHLDTFALLSGDSDFSPLVSKLKENNKYVIGIGVKGASSSLLIDNCDEFIYYEDVWRDRQKAPKLAGGVNKKNAEAFSLMIDAIQALVRENKDVLWGSMIKQTMQRKKPSFNEGYYGYGSFSELLEDAERNAIIKLKKDRRSGTYIVTGFASRKGA
jgi:uncharacterized protein (TIGR00288 family)